MENAFSLSALHSNISSSMYSSDELETLVRDWLRRNGFQIRAQALWIQRLAKFLESRKEKHDTQNSSSCGSDALYESIVEKSEIGEATEAVGTYDAQNGENETAKTAVSPPAVSRLVAYGKEMWASAAGKED